MANENGKAATNETCVLQEQPMRKDMAGYYRLRAQLGDEYQINHSQLRALDAKVEHACTLAAIRHEADGLTAPSQFAIVADATAKIQEWIAGHMHCAVSELAQAEIGRLVNAAIDTALRARPANEDRGCPCLYVEPCDSRCSCSAPPSSWGCRRCCSYGGFEQRKARAENLIRPAIDDAMVERIAIEAVSAVAGVDFDMCDADELHKTVLTAIREVLKGGAS